MASRRTPPINARLADEIAEKVRRNHEQRLVEVETRSEPLVIQGVVMPDTQNIQIAHKLGRRPRWVGAGCPRGALNVGIIRDVTGGPAGLFAGPVDPTQVVVLRADGHNATIVVDVLVL